VLERVKQVRFTPTALPEEGAPNSLCYNRLSAEMPGIAGRSSVSLEPISAANVPASIVSRLLGRRVFRQFAKFCVVGVTSMALDVGIAYYLTYYVHLHWVTAQVISFTIAVTNGFFWNSRWTFRGQNSDARHKQYVKFVLVNIIGLCLNVAVMKLFFLVLTGRLIGQGTPDPTHWKIAKAIAVVLVSLWNFTANKLYTFRDDSRRKSVAA